MKKRLFQALAVPLCLLTLLLTGAVQQAAAQDCFGGAGPVEAGTTPYLYSGTATGLTRSGSALQTSFVLGLPFAGEMTGGERGLVTGPFAYHLLEPRAVNQFAVSEGDFVDQIVITWAEEFAGAQVNQFRLLRNGSTLGTFPATVTEYIDQNVQAGRYYEYAIIALNSVGESIGRSLIGFVNPNGTVTGNIVTSSERTVPEVEVRLTPTLGASLEFDGADDAFGVMHADVLVNDLFTVEAWVFPRGIPAEYAPVVVKEGSGPADRSYGLFFMPDSRILEGSFHNGSELITVRSRTPVEDLVWSHLALSYDGTQLNLYVNGVREASAAASGVPARTESMLFVGKVPGRYTGYRGLIDDIRIWKTARTQQQVLFNQRRAMAAADTAGGLVAYWKLDENQGNKLFDLTPNNNDGLLCGPRFRTDRAPVANAAFTDLDGNYVIDGINYGSGTTFTVRPSKITQTGRAVSLNGTSQYLDLNGNLSLAAASFTIELWARRQENGRQQVLFSQQVRSGAPGFEFGFSDEDRLFARFGASTIAAPEATDDRWHHVAVSFQASNRTVKLYVDGEPAGSGTIPAASVLKADLQTGYVFGKGGTAAPGFYAGLLDDARIWLSVRSQAELQNNAQKIIAGNADGLAAYWRFNEGSRTFAVDQTGRSNNAIFQNMTEDAWSLELPYREEFVHTFTPESRKVTLNPSNTAVNSVNFTNTSLIKVSGYVRYFDSDCFADSVEVLVNGRSVSPPVFTDKSGKFEVEFEPGTSAQISPRFKDHEFVPSTYEVFNIAEPIANVVFDNMESRTVSGRIGGGACLNPIGSARVTLRSTNGCYEQVLDTDNAGNFNFAGVPPLNYTVTVDHPNPLVDAQLNGQEINAVEGDVRDMVFRYRSAPIVALNWLNTEEKGGTRYLEQLKKYNMLIRVYEQYVAGEDTSICAVDTGVVRIENGAANGERKELPFRNGMVVYSFTAGLPNIIDPYTREVLVDAVDDLNRVAQAEAEIIVSGNRPEEPRFATTSPQLPFMILHDPPGDASYAYFAKDSAYTSSFAVSGSYVESNGFQNTLSLGLDFTFETGILFSTETALDFTFDVETSMTATKTQASSSEAVFSFSSSETISTAGGEDYIGDEGDVYVGGALNLLYGVTNVLKIKDDGSVFLFKDLIMVPEKFKTTFMYTEKFILENLIPSLQQVGDTMSVRLWRSYVAKNKANKEKASFVRNLSFDAGVGLEYSETTESTSVLTNEVAVDIDRGTAIAVGFAFDGIGNVSTVSTNMTFSTGTSSSKELTKATTFGYVLSDDDPGDNFTVDVKKDPVYGSPVFKLISGQTSCPHEPGTQRRDRLEMTVRPLETINVAPDQPARFEVVINNLNLEEERDYAFSIDQTTNTGGSLFTVNGSDLSGGKLSFTMDPGGSQSFIVEAYRGPFDFEYEDIDFVAGSECDFDQEAKVSVSFNFRQVCSNVALFKPEPGWVLKQGDATIMPVTFYGYDVADPSISEVRVQYRRPAVGTAKQRPGDGLTSNDWIDIAVVKGEVLTDEFFVVNWETAPLGDGVYEIRALLSCSGDPVQSASQIVRGVIDRNAPRVLGTADPRDGVFGPGDQIYVQFNEPIDPNGINPLEDILLINAETGNPVDRDVTIFSNAIAIVPLAEDRFLENRVLRVEINRLKDLRGNVIENPITWEFLFDKSPVRWSNARVDAVSYLDQTLSFIRSFQNSGGSPISFELTGLPSWLTAFPMSGTLAPGTSVDIRFNVSRQLGAGEYAAVVRANTSLGNEPITISVRLLCGGPGWELDATRFSQSMNIVAELFVNGEQSLDAYDQVGFFIGNELRGTANVEFVAGLNRYQLYATVYANVPAEGPLSVRVWDASACLEYGSINETYAFAANTLLGTPQNPVTLSATRNIVQPLKINRGWTWFSMNTRSADMSVPYVLRDAQAQQGDVVRGQTAFSIFSPSAGWVGTLDTLRTGRMYQLNAKAAGEIILSGRPADLVRDSIALAKGWNWLGYNPTFTLNTNDALRNLVALNGDIIKSQTQFAVYVAGTGWVGNLAALAPLRGYLLFTRNGGRFTYPSVPEPVNLAKARPGAVVQPVIADGSEPVPGSPWTVNPFGFQYSMNLIAEISGGTAADTALVAAAFAGDEVRGVARPRLIQAMNRTFVFLTVYSNTEKGEALSFRIYDPATRLTRTATAQASFAGNQLLGSFEAPFVLNATATATDDAKALPLAFDLSQNYPNPFNGNTVIRYALPVRAEVSIVVYNLLGQPVATLVQGVQPAGYHTVALEGALQKSRMASGTYFYEMKAGTYQAIRKMVYLK